MRLSPQKELIVSKLREARGDWVCGSVWLGAIKDDRIRITELNRGYMREKGYEIIGEPCKGKACLRHRCPLFMRKAVKIEAYTPEKSLIAFENYQPIKTMN